MEGVAAAAGLARRGLTPGPPTAEVGGAARFTQAAGDQDLVRAAAGDHLGLTLVRVTLWGKKDRIEAPGVDPAWSRQDRSPGCALVSCENPVP